MKRSSHEEGTESAQVWYKTTCAETHAAHPMRYPIRSCHLFGQRPFTICEAEREPEPGEGGDVTDGWGGRADDQCPTETERDHVTRAPEPRPVTDERSGGGGP